MHDLPRTLVAGEGGIFDMLQGSSLRSCRRRRAIPGEVPSEAAQIKIF